MFDYLIYFLFMHIVCFYLPLHELFIVVSGESTQNLRKLIILIKLDKLSGHVAR